MQKYPDKILILGAGNLGLATGKTLQKLGFSICFYDIDDKKTLSLKKQRLETVNLKQDLTLITYIFICVPTPTIKNKISLEYLKNALNITHEIINLNKLNITLVIRSTILPGTIENLVKPFIRKHLSTKKCGLCYHPSFMRERIGVEDEQNPWLTIYACNSHKTELNIKKLWKNLPGKYIKVKFTEAELIKYGSNTFNANKISFYNQLSIIGNNLKLNGPKIAKLVSFAAEGNWNPHYGTKAGKPFGGACLPKDLTAFITFLKRNKLEDFGLFKTIKKINDQF